MVSNKFWMGGRVGSLRGRIKGVEGLEGRESEGDNKRGGGVGG